MSKPKRVTYNTTHELSETAQLNLYNRLYALDHELELIDQRLDLVHYLDATTSLEPDQITEIIQSLHMLHQHLS